MKKAMCAAALSLSYVLSYMPAVSANQNVSVYVDCNAGQGGDGTIEKPFNDIASAKEAVRKLKKTSGGNAIKVILREGNYTVDETIKFSAEDSGTEEYPITYSAYPMEKVTFSGGAKISFKDFNVANDSRISEDAKGKIYHYNLRQNGYSGYDKLYCGGAAIGYMQIAYPNEIAGHDAPVIPEVFFNDNVMSIARYPNGGEYLKIGTVIEPGENIRVMTDGDLSLIPPIDKAKKPKFGVNVEKDRLEKWKNEADMWASGYWYYDWSDQTIPIYEVNPDEQTIELSMPSTYTVRENQRFYVYNSLCEVDSPGEWYYDKDSGDFFVYPLDTKESSVVELGFSSNDIFEFDGCSYVRFENIDMASTRTNAISMTNSSDITIFGSEIKNISGNGIKVSESCKNITIDSCHVYSIGKTGIIMTAGNFAKQEPGNGLVQNCWVHNFGRISKTYNPALSINGYANTARYNKFSDGPHMGIGFGGNDNIIEYNEISEVLKEADDMGALYGGRSYLQRGNIIRGNIIHDLKSDSSGTAQYAVYLDDSLSGVTIEQNLIYNINGTGVFVNGGRDNIVKSNVFANLDCGVLLNASGLALTWGNGLAMLPTLGIDDSGIQKTEPYSKYPHLADILDDDNPMAPKYNEIKNNIAYTVTKPIELDPLESTGTNATEKMIRQWSEIEDIHMVKENVFEDAEKNNYLFKEDITKTYPGFEVSDFSKAGLITGRLKAKLSNNAVVLVAGEPVAYVNWQRRMIDPSNDLVAAKIKNNLTYVPVRFMAEMLGGDVEYADDKAIIKYGAKTLEISKDSNTALIDGERTELAGASFNENSRMYVPLRSCGELFDKEVFWDDRGLIVVSDTNMENVLDEDMIKNLVDRL